MDLKIEETKWAKFLDRRARQKTLYTTHNGDVYECPIIMSHMEIARQNNLTQVKNLIRAKKECARMVLEDAITQT